MPTPTYTPLANITLGSNASSVTFSSISQAYRDLVLVINVLGVGSDGAVWARFNSDTGASYNNIYMFGNGSSTGSGSNSADTSLGLYAGSEATTTTRGLIKVDILDYSATDKHKTLVSRSNNASVGVNALAGRWASTSAINSVTLLNIFSSSFAAGSTFALYGVAA